MRALRRVRKLWLQQRLARGRLRRAERLGDHDVLVLLRPQLQRARPPARCAAAAVLLLCCSLQAPLRRSALALLSLLPLQNPTSATVSIGDGEDSSAEDNAQSLAAWMAAVRVACPAGTYSSFDSDAAMCTDCPSGKIDDDFDPVSPCSECLPGRTPDTTRVQCERCPAGRTGRTEGPGCWACPGGKYSTGDTTDPCTACGAGTFAGTEAQECTECAALGQEDEDSDPVTPCKSGFHYYSQPIWEAYGQCWPSCEQMGGVVSLPFGAQQVQACCDSGCGVCTNN